MKVIQKLLIAMIPGFFFPAAVGAQDVIVCTSSSYSIPSVSSAGDNASYRWMENGVDIPGATSESYTNPAGKSTAGTYVYTRLAKVEDCNWQASNSIVVWVMGVDGLPVITSPEINCSGTDIIFSVQEAAGTRFEWAGDGGVAKGNIYTYPSAETGEKTVKVRAIPLVDNLECTSEFATASVNVLATPKITVDLEGSRICPNEQTEFKVEATDATEYQWYKDDKPVTDGEGANESKYVTPMLTEDAIYKVVAINSGACSVTSRSVAVTMNTTGCCNAPGLTIDFTKFNPCIAQTNSTWTLVDSREEDNKQSYKVKYMTDGRFWMVQDLKFGVGCKKKEFTGSTSNVQDKVAKGYYGDCRLNNNADAGYLYDWPAAINKADTYFGKNAGSLGCTGMAAAANPCRGLCPEGWHLPTKEEFDDAMTKFRAENSCNNTALCWNSTSRWEGEMGGYAREKGELTQQNVEGHYWTSTSPGDNNNVYQIIFNSGGMWVNTFNKQFGLSVRCVKNSN
jgi:uncharacterized protein (TIGR02145 family)